MTSCRPNFACLQASLIERLGLLYKKKVPKVKASVVHQFSHPPVIETVDDPKCPSNGVVVEIKACGVCRSDYHGWVGRDPDIELPHVMGHELAGIVVEAGADVRHFSIGDNVTAPFVLGCGKCPDCTSDNATICDMQDVIGFTMWGAFAEYISIPNADFNLVRLPDSMSFSSAAALGCRMTTAFRGLVDRGRLEKHETVVIHGCGGVGLSAIMISKAIGAEVIAVDVNEQALAMASSMGADRIINAEKQDNVGELVRDITSGGAHVSMDALGITATFNNSLRSLRKLGRHIQIGMPVGEHENVNLPLLELIYSRQLQICGSRGLSPNGFAPLIELIEAGKIDTSSLVSKEISLGDVPAALKTMDGFSGSGVKVITNFSQ